MKRILSLTLALIIAVSCTAVAFADNGSCGFAVATDLHYVEPVEKADGYFESEYFTTNEDLSKYENESGFIIDEFLSRCAEDSTCDFILIPGDLTTFGRGAADHAEQLAEKFSRFEAETGKQIYVINGNHDNGATANVNHTKFTEIYNDFGYNTAFAADESCCSYATNLNEKYGLIALDSCDENYSLANGVSTERLSWVKEQADAIRKSGRTAIMIMHHNLLEHYPLELIIEDKYIVSMPRTYASLFADWGIRLVFTGHTHMADAVSHTSSMGNVIYDFCTDSLAQYPFQFRKFEMTDDVVSYEMKNVEKIDTVALSAVVSGYTDEQLGAMSTDLVAYAGKREAANAEKILRDALTPESLDIGEDSPLYDSVNGACEKLKNAFSMKLYGENSLSALAEGYGIDIPESSYNNVWEAGLRVYLDFSSGEKIFSADSAELNIVFRAVQVALTDYIAETGDSEITKTLVTAFMKALGGATPSQRFIASILLPTADLYLNEGDGVDNMSGELKGFYAEESGLRNIISYISLFISRALRYFRIAFEALI